MPAVQARWERERARKAAFGTTNGAPVTEAPAESWGETRVAPGPRDVMLSHACLVPRTSSGNGKEGRSDSLVKGTRA
jgi:hypothetical protein